MTDQFPGCRRRAERCAQDHVVPFDHGDPGNGGVTDLANLHVLCKRHHRLKHEAGWSVRRIDGVTHWLSPGFRDYVKINDGYLTADGEATTDRVVDDPDPPPF